MITGFSGNQSRTADAADKKLVNSVSVYEDDFNTLKVVADRFSLSRNVLLISTFGAFVPIAWGADALGWQLHAIWAAFLAWMIVRGLLLSLHFEKNYTPSVTRAPDLP